MKVIAAVVASAAVCQAFVPTMTANNGLSRADFAKVLAAGVAGVAAPALAAGGSPKQNFFGVVGTAPVVGGGGFSSPYAEIETYSPYSPYSNTDKGIYTGPTDEITKRYIETIKDVKKRFEAIPGWAKGAKWAEIRSELVRKAYSLRGAMNALAKSEAAKTAAKAYYADIEAIEVAARRKEGENVLALYEKSVKDLEAYLAAL